MESFLRNANKILDDLSDVFNQGEKNPPICHVNQSEDKWRRKQMNNLGSSLHFIFATARQNTTNLPNYTTFFLATVFGERNVLLLNLLQMSDYNFKVIFWANSPLLCEKDNLSPVEYFNVAKDWIWTVCVDET